MKNFLKILVVIIIFFGFIFIGLNIFLNLKGKEMLARKLSAALDRDVFIGKISLSLPLNLQLKSFVIEGKKPAKTINLQMGLSNFFTNEIKISKLELIEPKIRIEKTEDGKITFPDFSSRSFRAGSLGTSSSPDTSASAQPGPDAGSQNTPAETAKKQSIPTINIHHIVVEDGEITYTDYHSEEKFSVTLVDFEMLARDFIVPLETVTTSFELSAKIEKNSLPFSDSTVESNGWLNIVKRDMDVYVEVKEPDGNVGLTAKLASQNNDMNVKGKINLKNIGSKISPSEEGKTSSFEDMVLGALQSSGLQVAANFNFDTKMDDFSVDTIALNGNIGFNFPEGGMDSEKQKAVDFKNLGKQFETFGKKFYEGEKEELGASLPTEQTVPPLINP